MNAPEREPALIKVPAPSRIRRDDPADNPVTLSPTPGAAGLLQAMTSAVSLSHVDMDKVERLFAMQKEIRAQEATAAYNNAMARAQANMPTVGNDRTNDHTRSQYATRAAINQAIKPIYTAEGLSVEFRQVTKGDEADPIPAGHIRLRARVAHSAGHIEISHEDFPVDDAGAKGNVNKTPIQAHGSTKEYGMRYMLKGIFNLATGEEPDDDGNGRQEREPAPREEPAAKPAYGDDQIDKNLTAWGGLVDTGKQTADSVILKIKSKATLTEGQEETIRKALA